MIDIITSTTNWKSFHNTTLKLSKFEKGHLFEILTYQVLKNHYRYASILKNVWLLRDNNIPHDVKKHLNLTNSDEGIDLIAETNNGDYWAIQCKFKTNNEPPTVKELSTFTNLSYNYCNNISNAILFHTGEKGVKKKHLLGDKYLEVGLDFWLDIQDEEWNYIVQNGLAKDKIIPLKRSPRKHQKEAIQASVQYYLKDKNTRGKLIMPCGAGKSLAAYWIAETLNSKSTIVAVPSLALIKQSLDDWTKEMVLGKRDKLPDWLCICSDKSTGKVNDDFVSDTYSLGIPTTTSESEITSFLNLKSPNGKIIFTTYQSADKLAVVSKKINFKFDLAILDEAHKTVGAKEKSFSILLRDNQIDISKRMFMTATERIVKGSEDDVLSMDDETIYGKKFYQLTFKKAINENIITDYKIITVIVNSSEIQDLINKNRFLSDKNVDIEAEAQMLTTAIALKKAIHQYDLKHTVSFHRSISASIEFKDLYSKIDSGVNSPTVFQISSKLNAGQRSELLNDFKYCPKAIITNAKCLTEGVDVQSIDCVLFADQKNSIVDIVQASGRALRQYTDKLTGYKKELGYIIIPIVLNEGETFEDLTESSRFKTVVRIVSSLSTQDETIAEELKLIEGNEKIGRVGKLEIIGSVNKTLDLDFSRFSQNIITKIWKKVAKVNIRSYKESNEFVKKLGFKSSKDWWRYCKSGDKPFDIPNTPYIVYKDWINWAEWLGTKNYSSNKMQYKGFEEAREFARSLNFKNQNEWVAYCQSGNKPDSIPTNVIRTYKNKGWSGFPDWLGTNIISNKYRVFLDFEDARKYARNLNLKNIHEWNNHYKSKQIPINIPSNPQRTYKDEWVNWGDWLGTFNVHGRDLPFLRFEEARNYVRNLNLKNQKEWSEYCKSELKPDFIPGSPYNTYKDEWQGLGDWLGTFTVHGKDMPFLGFEEARLYVHKLNLKSVKEWTNYWVINKRPENIPYRPDGTYKNKGWVSWSDWLGTNNIASNKKTFLPFIEARENVRKLKFKSGKDFKIWKKANPLILIPVNPDTIYKKKGWNGWPDWLGNTN
jgi:superfamily II DNA or RNA helicase